jgi:acetylglutamate kinase
MTQNPQDSKSERIELLAEALPYIQKYRGKVFVLKYGGSAMEDETVVSGMLRDVVFLEAVGINPVLIHGGGKAITQKMAEAGVDARFVNGLRVTDQVSVRIVQQVLEEEINPRIVGQIRQFGGRATGLRGSRILEGRKMTPQRDRDGSLVDLGFVGEVFAVQMEEVRAVLAQESIPVISPLAHGPAGEFLNINADIAAGVVAGELGAVKMIYLSDVPGLLRDPKDPSTLISSLSEKEINHLVATGVISGGMLPKVRSALNALGCGVEKVHFIDGRVRHAILREIFTDAGFGTEIIGETGSSNG